MIIKQLIQEVEQVTERLVTNKGQCKVCIGCIEESNCKVECGAIDDCLEKLAEYETAEKEGRLVVLPCKVGDTVYLIDDIDCVFERESIVTEIEIDKDSIAIMIQDKTPICSSGYSIADFGEIVFLTREEAEKALKEMEEKV